MESNDFEVVVIGAGIMGSATAYYLSKTLGSKVLLLEQFDRLHKRGSSHGESRIIRMTYSEDFNTRLMFDAYKFWAEIEAEAKTKLLTKTGGVILGPLEHPGIQTVIKNLNEFQIPYDILSPAEVAIRFPAITLPEGHIALYQADAGVLNATKCLTTLQNLAKENGCRFLDNAPVTKISESSELLPGIRIETKDGRIFGTKRVIVTAGAWTRKLLKDFKGLDLPLQPAQTTVAYWKVDSPELYAANTFPVLITYTEDSVVYGLPALEYPNLIKCCGDEFSRCDPDNRSFEPGWACLNELVIPFMKQCLKGVSLKPAFTESCIYTVTPDRQFIVDGISDRVFIGCGFSGHGFKLGPLIGKLLAELAISGTHLYPEVHPHFTYKRFEDENPEISGLF